MAAKEISVKRYVVRLSADEREQLQALIRRGKSSAKRLLKARILLKADVSEAGEGLYEEGQVETDMSGQHFFTSLDVCGIHGLIMSPICMTRLVAEPYPNLDTVRCSRKRHQHPACGGQGLRRAKPFW